LREQTLGLMKHQPAPLPSEITKELDRMATQWE